MSNLPSGYIELEYIEFNRSQYINTGIKPDETLEVIIDYEMLQSTYTNNYIFGSRDGTSVNTYDLGLLSGTLRSGYNNQNIYFSNGINTYQRLTYTKNKNVCNVDGYTVTANYASFTGSYDLYLFALNNAGSLSSAGVGRCYSCKIYKDSSLIRDYIPCKNESDVSGLYDLVNSEFYGSASSKEFVAGPEIVKIPEPPSSAYQLTAVVISWNSVECDGYNIYKNGSFLQSTTETLFVDSNISDGQEIEYSITSFNSSGESDPVNISVHVKEGYTILIPIVNSAFFQ